MFKDYVSKLPFLQSKSRRKERPEWPPAEEENLWPEGDPFAETSEPAEENESSAMPEQPDPPAEESAPPQEPPP